ncbi:pyroglutamyl-peptidase 1-like [Mercenaria mercenaria]|uniref:pyroglutamyl-peptidase 1-like n=1 Tax=Mercenaria mercenaria TaxID=6596 RepID=UPI00234E86F5|nr:pyroglutamyl-peptidase 1-like [Mercenaria mercenaria]
MKEKTVVVTGFGPFGSHKVNASWECVKLLKEQGLGEEVDVFIYELPVEYNTVKRQVPQIWDSHKPDLVVHVGVSGIAKEITLEQQAHNDGYDREDIQNCKADDLCCVPGADDCLIAGLDMENVCDKVNKSGTKTRAVVSHDAGRYLCDFSYFTSLHINRNRTAFIHVPPLGQPYSIEELVEALRVAILGCWSKLIDIHDDVCFEMMSSALFLCVAFIDDS